MGNSIRQLNDAPVRPHVQQPPHSRINGLIHLLNPVLGVNQHVLGALLGQFLVQATGLRPLHHLIHRRLHCWVVECNLYVQWVKHRGERFTATLLIRNSLRILSGARLQEGLYLLHIIRATDHHKRIPGVAQTDDGAGCIVGCCGGDGLLRLLLSNPLHRDHRTQLTVADQPVYPSGMHASGTDQLSDSQNLRGLR